MSDDLCLPTPDACAYCGTGRATHNCGKWFVLVVPDDADHRPGGGPDDCAPCSRRLAEALEVIDAVKDRICPTCGAKDDEHCTTASGRDHNARRML